MFGPKFIFIPVVLSILAIGCATGILVLTYRAEVLSKRKRLTNGLSLITAAFCVFIMAELTKGSLDIRNFAFRHGDLAHAALVTFIDVWRVIAPFVFGGVGAGMVLNSLIHGKNFE